MDPGSHKHYHLHEFDPKDLLATYCSPHSDKTLHEDIIVFPMKNLLRLMSAGKIKGKTLIDFSTGPFISHLLPMCDYFSDIIILETNDFCMKEMEKWHKGEEEAFDWSHLSEHFSEVEGGRNKWIEIEDNLRRKIKNIMAWDLSKENPTKSFALPKADCLMCFYIIGHISENHEAYSENVKKLSSFLHVGGHLLVLGTFNGKFYSIGEHKIHSLTIDEEFFRKVLADAGFTIEHLEKFGRKFLSNVAKYDQVFLASAVKVREL